MNAPPSAPDRFSARFWYLVGLSRTSGDEFRTELARLSKDELGRLYWTYVAAMGDFRQEPYETLFESHLSDDAIDTVTKWIVARGREYYDTILEVPELMPRLADVEQLPKGDVPDPLVEILKVYRELHGGSPEFPENDEYLF